MSTDLAAGVASRVPACTEAGAVRRARRRIPGWRRPMWWLVSVISVGALTGYVLTPAAQAAGSRTRKGKEYNGTSAVGALFTMSDGKLGSHFCSASVVHSKTENILITAAHCVYRDAQPPPGSLAFVPDYHSGLEPHGVWGITAVYVDKAWMYHRNVNNDVAFLIAGRPGTHIERHTGADVLGIGKPAQMVQVVGYPDGLNKPITCVARARVFATDSRQLVFDCDGYTTGTSGSPFLAQVHAKTGEGTVIGVIGGWQEGGDSPNVSYSARFFTNVKDLYNEAVAGDPPPTGGAAGAGPSCPTDAAMC